MRAPPLQRLHGAERNGRVPWYSQVVAVDVDRMGQAELVGRVRERVEYGSGGYASAGEWLVKPVQVPLSRLPGLDPARVHDLDGVGAGRADEPGRIIPGALPLACLDLAQEIFVIAHQDEDPTVNAWRIVQLCVAV